MASKTHYAQNLWQNWKKGMPFPPPPSGTYLALFTSDPTDAGLTSSEVSGNGYARQGIGWGSLGELVDGCLMSNSGGVSFGMAGGAGWGTVTHAAEMDALTGGNMLEHAPLDEALVVGPNFQVTFPVGNVTDLDQ